MKGRLHAHGCTRCHVRYTDACVDLLDGHCTACRGGRAWQLLIDSAAPHDCCFEKSRLITKDDKERYSLAGGHLWHICTTCSRTHPCKPRRQP